MSSTDVLRLTPDRRSSPAMAKRPDGAVEWACPWCGRYLARYPDTQLVLTAGAPDTVHVLGEGYPAAPIDVAAMSAFDQQFLHAHAMGW